VNVKKFHTREPFELFWNFSEQVENLSWYVAVRPFSFAAKRKLAHKSKTRMLAGF